MGEKVIIRSATVDRHGDYIPLQHLEDYVNTVNGNQKLRYLINHRRDLPPIGYFDNAEIQLQSNLYHVLVEPIAFHNKTIVSWNNSLIIEDAGLPITFIQRNEMLDQVRISADKNNFKSFDSFNEIGAKLQSLYDEPIALEASIRKSLILDPQIVITIGTYYSVVYPLLKPFLKKIGERFADDIADDIYETGKVKAKKLVNSIADSVAVLRKVMIPENKSLITIFEIPGVPYIELQIRSDSSIEILKAISSSKLSKIHKQVSDLEKNIDISEIYFIYNKKEKWEFTYLITKSGQTIGTKEAFNRRNKLVKRVNLSPTKAFSIGAEGVKFQKFQK
ncbi:hypothetical protein [Daejeonella sp. H1SJ63]|uniref:hypothetical protein n=1 Tax=Daejeonella sp. H1SJ63 TaxID=3034145 RepID=UPI0023EACB5B|nr:hypothetical protein [Daejeonella sp. H1SJ63]